MTKKIRQAYLALSTKFKIGIAISLLVTLLTSSFVAFAADPGIVASGWTPAQGSTINAAKPSITLSVTSQVYNLNPGSVKAKIDGNSVYASIELVGYWETDSCANSYYVVSNPKAGTITVNSPELSDGVHNVEVIVADISGNTLTETWAFTVDGPPTFTNISPGASSIVGSVAKVSAVISDGTGVDWSSVVVKLDGTIVQHTTDEASGTVTYEGVIADGIRTVSIEAKDLNGNVGSKTWSFNCNSTKPVASAWSPAKDGSVSVANPPVSVYIYDSSDNLNPSSLSAKIDGNAVTATFKFKGHIGPIYYDDPVEPGWGQGYIIDSYREGTVSFTAPTLTDGVHEAEINIADSRGNLLTEKWSFTVKAPPTFASISPAAGSSQSNPTITAVVSDNSAIDWGTVVMKINNNAVATEVYQETGTITYQGSSPAGTVNVYLEAKDTAGNLGSKTWSFTNSVTGPQFKTIYYRTHSSGVYGTVWPLTDGFTITNGTLWFDGNIDDLVKITSVTATLDGVPLAIQSTPPTYWAYRDDPDDPGYLAYNDMRHVWYKYTGVIKDGEHTLVVTAKNEVGVTNTLTRKFIVNTPPVISNSAPLQYGVTDLTPLISVDVKDLNGTIVPDSVILTVDGTAVARNYDATVNKVTYQSGELSDESYHTVTLSAYDDSGLNSTHTWKFYTNTKNYLDMADSNIQNCNTCHTKYTTLQSHSAVFGGDHGDRGRCQQCHDYVSVGAGCAQCHGDPDYDWLGYAPHGSSPSIKYNATNFDPNFPLRIKTNREMYDCVICHQPGSKVMGHPKYPDPGWALVAPTMPVDGHDIPELHKYTNDSCNKCHAQSLTKEHARPGRVDKDGKAITCNTCHQSTNPDVVSAIANHKKDCSACHIGPTHDALHNWNEFDAQCQTCHQKTLTTEHMNRVDATGKNYECAVCHESTKQAVKRTIASSKLNCSGCHTTGHKFPLGDTVPTDIPLYPGYEWTSPIEAAIFQGDPTMPSGYDSGQVTISNRVSSVAIDQVWGYYNQQTTGKMAANGWTQKSGSFVAGATTFVAEYEKESRLVTIKCYKSALSDGTGPLGSAYRVEIWYK